MKKLKKLIDLISKRGYDLKNPLQIFRLMINGIRFIFKHGVNSSAALKNSLQPWEKEDKHFQIWERIKPAHIELVKMRLAIPNLKKHYKFSIVIQDNNNDTVSSIKKQIYDKWEIITGNVSDCINACGDYVLFLMSGDFLHKHAFFELNFELNRIDKTPPLIYFDHDYFVNDTVDKPCYKPEWSDGLLKNCNYINRACIFRADLLKKLNIIKTPFKEAIYNIIQKTAEFGEGHHIKGILMTLQDSNNDCDYNSEEDKMPVVYRYLGIPSLSPIGINKIIIVKLDHIGDIILSMPAIRKIRQIFPEAIIDLLCGPWVKSIMENQPEINNIYTLAFFNEDTGNWNYNHDCVDEVIIRLKKEKYDLAVNLRRQEEAKHITSQLADYCLEYSENADYDKISHPLSGLKDIPDQIHKWNLSDQLLLLCRSLEYEQTLYNELYIPQEKKIKVDEYINKIKYFQNRLLIGIHIGSGNMVKVWPFENFIELCNLINEKLNAGIVLVGNNKDTENNEKVISLVKKRDAVISVAGAFSLLEFCYFVKKINYFIGNDSGPAHIAGIQGVSSLVISHGLVSAAEYSAIGKAVMQVQCSAPCMPCYSATCNECIKRIQPDDVFAGLERLMLLFPSEKNRDVES